MKIPPPLCSHRCRAFAGATIHDCFNWLSVLVLLPLEAASGLTARTAQLLVGGLSLRPGEEAPELLRVLTEPLTQLIVQVSRPAGPQQSSEPGSGLGNWGGGAHQPVHQDFLSH